MTHTTKTRPAIENTPVGRIGGHRAYCTTCPWIGRTLPSRSQAEHEAVIHGSLAGEPA